MRIAILGSVSAKIPPSGQAAIERLAYQQALGLAGRGHKVLLFALKGSSVPHGNVEIVEVGEKESLSGTGKEGEKKKGEDLYGVSYKMRLEIVNLAYVLEKLVTFKDKYDVILNNLRGEAVLVPTAKQLKKPFYHVLHLPVFPDLAKFFRENQTKLISISNAQRTAFPDLNYKGTVYNGVDPDEFSFSAVPRDYVLYLGSIGPNKNPKGAILSAREARVKILLGGRIKNSAYFNQEIKPLIDNDRVQWVGEKNAQEVVALYRGARAFLFPTEWQEPFGLVVIEALSCGTPVIAYPNGALPEIITDGENGYLVDNVSEMAEKIKEIGKISRENCRQSVLRKFTIEKMIENYEKVLTS